MKQYLYQMELTSDCFVLAAANCLIHLDLPVGDLERARDIAGCRGGKTLRHAAVMEYLHVPAIRTLEVDEVCARGGIIGIMHPLVNGHAIFVFPDGETTVTAVNSWIGPPIWTRFPRETLLKFLPRVCGQFGPNWVLG